MSGAVTLSRAPDALPDSAYLRARPPRYALRTRTVIQRPLAEVFFVDAQVRGPYACWWHEHAFDEEEGRTIMDDLVLYAPPLGPLGRLAQHVIVARQLRHIFSYRARTITRLYGA